MMMTVLTACSGGETNGSDGPSSGVVTFNSYTITGTDANQTDGSTAAIIDASQNGGQWELVWSADAPEPWLAELHLSTDATVSDDDLRFLQLNCDVSSSSLCARNTRLDCIWNSASELRCGPNTSGNQNRDASTYLAGTNGVPGNYFVLLRGCNSAGTGCDVEAIEVTLR